MDRTPGPLVRPHWTDLNNDSVCDVCLHSLDDCRCACAFCGETTGCVCSIGIDVVTGG